MLVDMYSNLVSYIYKVNTCIAYQSVILLLGLHPAKTETLILTDTCTSTFTVALLSIAIQVSINGQIYEEDVGYTQWDIIQSLQMIKICHLKQ